MNADSSKQRVIVQVSITIDEKIVAQLNRDGGVEQFELNGVMTLEVCLVWM